MKSITMLRDFDYRPSYGVIIAYIGGETYERVPEAAAAAIIAAQAGEINGKASRSRTAAGENEGVTERGEVSD